MGPGPRGEADGGIPVDPYFKQNRERDADESEDADRPLHHLRDVVLFSFRLLFG